MMPADKKNDASSSQQHLDVDHVRIARWGALILLLGLGGFLAWAGLAPLNQGVPVDGFIKVESNRKSVQHLTGGIVDAILIQEGETVKSDQPLIRLNETQSRAQLGIVEGQLINALATLARLQAEQRALNKIDFPPFLIERAQSPLAKEAMFTQELLLKSRRAALQGEELIGKQTIASLEHQIQGLESLETSKKEQIRLFSDELNAIRPLQEQGYVPKTHVMELERSIANFEGQRGENISAISRARSEIGETRLKILQGKENYRKEVESELADLQEKVGDLNERYVAVKDSMDRTVIRSPAAGVVVNLSVHTVGGVVNPGQVLMDVIPSNDSLVIEVRIPTHLIDNVKPGLNADIHFSALDQSTTPTITGQLAYVSADRLMDPRTDIPYFLGKVTVAPDELKRLGKHDLQPGMPANVIIKTGERTMLSYLTEPLYKRLHEAFTER